MFIFSVLLLLIWVAFCYSKGVSVIVGSAINVHCPFGRDTQKFKVPSEKDDAPLDITPGHLYIPEARIEHSGLILCSDGRQEVPAKNVVVVPDPGRYKAEMVSSGQLFRGESFHLECRLRVPEVGHKARVRFLMDGKPFPEGDFSDSRPDPKDRLVRLFWLDRHLPVTRTDAGRTVQCEVRVPFGELCCPRSAKLKLKVEEPLHFETHNMVNKTVKSGHPLNVTLQVRHWLPFNGSEVSVINENQAKMTLITRPKVTPIGPHVSNVALNFIPEKGIHYVALDRQLTVKSPPIRVAFASEKEVPRWKSPLHQPLVMAAVAVALMLLFVLLALYVFWRRFNKERWIRAKEENKPSNKSSARDDIDRTIFLSEEETDV